ALTVSVALATLPVTLTPLPVAVTLPVVLLAAPGVELVTLTRTWQLLAPAASVPPLKLNEVLPGVAPVTVPPQVLVRPGVAATVRPAGRLSVTAKLLSATLPAGLLNVSVSWLT